MALLHYRICHETDFSNAMQYISSYDFLYNYNAPFYKKIIQACLAMVLYGWLWVRTRSRPDPKTSGEKHPVFSNTFVHSKRYPAARKSVEETYGLQSIVAVCDALARSEPTKMSNLLLSLKGHFGNRRPIFFAGLSIEGRSLKKAVEKWCRVYFDTREGAAPGKATMDAILEELNQAYFGRLAKLKKTLSRHRIDAHITVNQYNLRDLLLIHAMTSPGGGVRTIQLEHNAMQFARINFSEEKGASIRMQKVDFVFEYEVKPREFASVCLLAAYLRNKGYSTAIVNSWTSLYRKPPAYHAEVAVISACYGDGTYDYFTGYIASYKKVVNMQWEQVLINGYYKERDDAYIYKDVGLQTRHVCWGEAEKAWLQKDFGIDEKYLKVVGYLPLDFYRKELYPIFPSREQIFKRYGLDPAKKTLLFVSSFSAVDFPESEDYGGEDIFRISEKISRESQKLIFDWFVRFLNENPDVQIVYRYHPSEKNSLNVQKMAKACRGFYAIQDEPISYWIMSCDKIYNWCSTSMIEMLSSGKDVYLCRPIPLPEIIDYTFFENAQCVDTYEKFEESALEQKMKMVPVNEQLLAQWYDTKEEPAYKRIGDWLIETYHDTEYSSRPSKNNIHKSQVWKKIKRPFRQFIAYTKLSEYGKKCLGENTFTRRLQKIQSSVLQEDKYRRAVREKDGYQQSRYRLNSFTDEEAESMIARFQKLIADK